MKRHLVLFFAMGMLTLNMHSQGPYKGDRVGNWNDLINLGFHNWRTENCVYLGSAADGGSIGFRFTTTDGNEFVLKIAVPLYWTDKEKKMKKQVFFIVHRFEGKREKLYKVVENGEEETVLLRMLDEALKQNSDEDEQDLMLRAAKESLESRKIFQKFLPKE